MFQGSQDEEMSPEPRGEESPEPQLSQVAGRDEIDVKPKLNLLIMHVGQQITVRVKANMPFRKIFEAAAQSFKKEPGLLRFTYGNVRIRPEDTPAGLGMDDNDEIEANLEQLGGGSVAN